MSMIGFARLVTVAAGLVVCAASLPAQSKVGIVNLQKALQDAQEVKDAQSKIEAAFKPRSERIAQLEKEVAKLQQEYDQTLDRLQQAGENAGRAPGMLAGLGLSHLPPDLPVSALSHHRRKDALSFVGGR